MDTSDGSTYLPTLSMPSGEDGGISGSILPPGTFELYDYVIFALTLLISMGIGVYFAFAGGRQRTTGEYLSGDRRLSMFPVAMSMFMSGISAIIVLGNAAEAYEHDTVRWAGTFLTIIGDFISAFIFVPLYYPLGITSLYEYFNLRFKSKSLQLLGALSLLIGQILYVGITLYAPAVALESVTGISLWTSILSTAIVGTIYTSLGGMKAVVWTDTFQGMVLFGGLLTVLCLGTAKAGGIVNVFEVSRVTKRLRYFQWDVNPFLRLNTWGVLASNFFWGFAMGTHQTSVQRICATKSQRHAIGTVLLMSPMIAFVYTITMLTGLVALAYYEDLGCDPLQTGQITMANQVLPFFIQDALRIPCLSGLFVAVLFSGALSSFSSSLNSAAAVTWKDILEVHFRAVPESRKALVTKILTFTYGAIGTAVAFMYQNFGGNVMQVSTSLLSSVFVPTLSAVVAGSFFPWANWIGTFTGCLLSTIFTFVVTLANNLYNAYQPTTDYVLRTDQCWRYNLTVITPANQTFPVTDVHPLFRLSFAVYSPIGITIAIVLSVVLSLMTGGLRSASKVDQRHLVGFARRLFGKYAAAITNNSNIYTWSEISEKAAEKYTEGKALELQPVRETNDISHTGESKKITNDERPTFY